MYVDGGVPRNESYRNMSAFQYTEQDTRTGYQQTFNFGHGETIALEVAEFEKLKANRWLDEYTNYVIIDSTMYNHNLKIWAACEYHIEVHGSGQFIPTFHISALTLEPYAWDDPGSYWLATAQIAYVGLFLVYFFKFCRGIFRRWQGTAVLHLSRKCL